MRKFLALGAVFLVIFSLGACALTKPDEAVKLSIESSQGEPIPDGYVYAEKYPDGREVSPGPLLGVTDENGILEYIPEQYGTQELVCLQYGFTTEGKEARIGQELIPYGVVSVEITREDIKKNRVISVQIPLVPFEE